MSDLLRKIEEARMRAAEEAAIASIPADLLAAMKRADEKYAADGGCPGCGSKVFGAHTLPCSWRDEHPDFY